MLFYKFYCLLHLSFEGALSYRTKMNVTEIRKLESSCYPVCPRCNMTFEREYQAYCDRCGQALGWNGFSNATVVDPWKSSK